SLKLKLHESTQVVLISAVMPNSKEIGRWLIGEKFVPVEASYLTPTNRSIAFVSWVKHTGLLKFVNENDIEFEEFYVPKLLERYELKLKGRERKKKYYPSDSPSHIAGSLACRLSKSGTVAIFTGRKESAIKISKDLVDAFERDAPLENPFNQADGDEMDNFITYIGSILGEDSPQYKAAKYGILIHHGNTPHGLRLATENALQKEHVKVVICTSTLAQGVNLPIRYLLVTTSRQGKDEIKVRDFHNLIGRAGRAGKYTEGTIIFSNSDIYDKKNRWSDKWRWDSVKKLLDQDYSENCTSFILKLLDSEPQNNENKLNWQENINNILDDINSYLIDALSELEDNSEIEVYTTNLVKNTLGYSQATEDDKNILINIFIKIAKKIIEDEPEKEKRKIYSQSIFNLEKSKEILSFLNENVEELNEPNSIENILEILWPIIYHFNSNFKNNIPSDLLLHACKLWIRGELFINIFNIFSEQKFGNRHATIDHIVNLCENGFGFDGSLIIGVCLDLKELIESWGDKNLDEISLLQKCMKYGLPDSLSIKLYNLGLTDRLLSLKVSEIVNNFLYPNSNRDAIINALRYKKDDVILLLNNYPIYFRSKFNELIKE
ncbi:MAG: helicase-related protein, partial [Senegalia sp. (in: firmicutes)]|uniref:helicase-related protein n=1 Tax=Senegalia sp. (in: firmicutes) TaxID=1924098 RepID=UPI003F9E398F